MLRAHYMQDSTFVSAGSLLDHVYIRKSSLGTFKDVKCEVKSVYYSHHDYLSDNVGKDILRLKITYSKWNYFQFGMAE